MKHRHPGRYKSRTPRGRTVRKKRPIHCHRINLRNKYQRIVDRAKAKGYKVYDLDRLQSTVDEVDIPEIYKTDGLIVPDKEGKQRRDLIFIDDDAKKDYQIRAFAHELGHQHLFATGQDKEEPDHSSNIPAIEKKADKIGADILDMSVKKFNSPDVTYKDVVSGRRNFIQSLFHAGNEPPSEKIAKGEPVFGFSSKEFADAWADKHGYDDVYQFQTDDYDLDEKQYIRERDGEKVISDNEFIARNVLKEEEVD